MGSRDGLSALIALTLGWSGMSCAAEPTPAAIKQGHALAKNACGRCHAIEGPGPSPLKDVPVFSLLLQDFPGRNIEEVLAQGLMTPHRPMPMFLSNNQDMDNLAAYLASIQVRPASASRPGS